MTNPVRKIQDYGQSIWLDYIRRGMLVNGELRRLIENDGLRGVTVNPSILQKAIAGSQDYDDEIRSLALEDYDAKKIYEMLAIEDVRSAADLFLPMYEKTNGKHGFVSLEVSPHLAYDTEGTIEEATRFWHELDRPNVMIKVPATQAGLPAIERLIEAGINVNVTLLFGLPRYRQVVKAYLNGLKARMVQGRPLHNVSSVASFFLSRIDVLIDPELEAKIKLGGAEALLAAQLHGQAAVASAKIAYQIYREVYSSKSYQELADEGARPQRLLWASTSTKNPQFSDVKYVEALIGPDTVNTIPLETLNAYRDHGDPMSRLEDDVEEARRILSSLQELDIDLDQLTQQLEDEGVKKFDKSYDHLIKALKEKRSSSLGNPIERQTFDLGDNQPAYDKRLKNLEETGFVNRLWNKDTSLWKDDPSQQEIIQNALGWLHSAEKMEENLKGIDDFVEEVKSAGFRHIVHLGMGGSSLAPMVLDDIFQASPKDLAFSVLDTTNPDAILELERFLPLHKTLFIVASKSGTTAETRALADHFYQRLIPQLSEHSGDNFIAITDPGSPLVEYARQKGFRRTFLNFSDIGGRYSALSYFGLLPAALMGIDVSKLLDRALRMSHACATCVPLCKNPGVMLGAAMGEMAQVGRDKVTILTANPLGKFGMWLEQLLAESTGKEGKGLLPVVGEPVGQPRLYGSDRLFVYLRMRNEVSDLDDAVAALRKNGQPVITILLDDLFDIGGEFLRWEIATATAGAILHINAFDQPNVQESKDITRHILEMVEKGQMISDEQSPVQDGSFKIYFDGSVDNLDEALMEFLSKAGPEDYIALMAFVKESLKVDRALQELRTSLREFTHLATTKGYGPRFLHSTGQYHKGGPKSGLFIQLTAEQNHDLQVIGHSYTFGEFFKAQAAGDLQALHNHGRRVIHIHLGEDALAGLTALQHALKFAGHTMYS